MPTPVKAEPQLVRLHREQPHVAAPAALKKHHWLKHRGVAALLVILGVAAMSLDLSLARWFNAKNLPDGMKKVCDLVEVFGHGFGVAIIVLAAWFLAPAARPKLPRVLAMAYLAGLAAVALKLVVARLRPNRIPLEPVSSIADAWRGWLPGTSTETALQSFPSGHCATAIGLAIGLTLLFPRGKWLFAFLFLLVAVQRMAGGYHYLSDTLWGAAVGWLVASAFLPGRWLGTGFDRLEGQLLANPNASR